MNTCLISKSLRDYEIIDQYQVGLVLEGDEIKSLRSRQFSLDGAYIFPYKGELFAMNINIANYKYSRKKDLSRTNKQRKIKLLLKKREITKITNLIKVKGYVVIPFQTFITEKGWAKLKIAVARRLRKYQIKAKIKEKEIKRELQRDKYED